MTTNPQKTDRWPDDDYVSTEELVRRKGVRPITSIEDLAADPRFDGNSFVHGPSRMRSYIGAPVILSTGDRVGAQVAKILPGVVEELEIAVKVVGHQVSAHRADGGVGLHGQALVVDGARWIGEAQPEPGGRGEARRQ